MLALVSLLLLCVMILVGSFLPVPYVIERPGPAIDVLGEYDGEQILVIDGAETHPTDGALMMTTVSVDGAANAGLLAARILAAGEGEEAARLRSALVTHAAELNAQAQAKGARLRDRLTPQD